MFYITLLGLGLLILGAILVLSFPPLRRFLLVRPLLTLLKKVLPTMSRTEEIVLEAGDMWWEKDLFRGKPDWQALHKISLSSLTSDGEYSNNCVSFKL